jgi:hypothetical protein
MARSFEACIARVAAKGSIGQQEASQILEGLAERADQMRASGVDDPLIHAAHEAALNIKEKARNDRMDALRNAAARQGILDNVETNGGIDTAETTLRSLLHGTNIGSRDNIESMWKGNASLWTGKLGWQVRKEGLEKVAIRGLADRQLANAIWELNAGRPLQGQGPIENVARAVQTAMDGMRNRLNAAGARIGDAVDYVTHTSHDPSKMRRAAGARMSADDAFKTWWEFTQPKLADKTFEDVIPNEGESTQAAQDRFGRAVFEALVTGIRKQQPGEEGSFGSFFQGSNLARRVSEGRALFWKDADAWHDYMQQYGKPKSLMAGIMGSLETGARQLALMDKLGTSPTNNFDLILRRIQERYRDNIDGVKNFQGRIEPLQRVMSQLDGSANIPASEAWAKFGSVVRTWETMSSLGGVGLTHFASIWPTVTSEMVHHGVPRLQTLGNLVRALVEGKGSAERQEILADLGAYAHGLNRDMFARYQADDLLPGRVSSLANTFMKYTGIHYIFDNTQAAVRSMLANQLGRNIDKEFGQLEPHLAQMIEKYGIGAKEWDQLRSVRDLPTFDDRTFMAPDSAQRIEGLSQAEKDTLSDKLSSYYEDAAAHGVVTPGVRERAMLRIGRPGTAGGEMMRFLTQFKMWPAAAMNQIIGREIHMSLSRGEAAWNLGILAALSMAGGYFRMVVNDLATGNPPRDIRNPATMFAALAQGGGIGILGDFLFGETNRMGAGLVSTALGPVASDADTFVRIFTRFRDDLTTQNPSAQGRFHNLWGDLAHFAVRHVPFANMVYLKGALDYLLWYHLYEAASPGWWQRTNRRLQKEQGRTMQGFRPGAPIPYTPWAGS